MDHEGILRECKKDLETKEENFQEEVEDRGASNERLVVLFDFVERYDI